MARILDFNAFEQPTLPVVMKDADRTKFTVTAPSVELIQKLEANQEGLEKALKNGDENSLAQAWKLAAELISCNDEGRQVTATDLQEKYRMTYVMLFAFFKVYGELVDEIESAKN
jgi:hypothetical protein